MTFAPFKLIKVHLKLDFRGDFHLDIYGTKHIHFISFEKEWKKSQPLFQLNFFIYLLSKYKT